MHACMRACIQTHIHTYMRTCILDVPHSHFLSSKHAVQEGGKMGKKGGAPAAPAAAPAAKRARKAVVPAPVVPAPDVRALPGPAVPAPSAGACSSFVDTNVNTKILKRVADAKATIFAHPIFQDITTAAATAESGLDAFAQDLIKQKLNNHQNYMAAFNVFQVVDFARFMTPDTPVHLEKVQALADHFWSPVPKTSICPYTLVVAALPTDFDNGLHSLPMLSPPEYAWALLLALEEAIDSNASDQELTFFRSLMLSFSVRVECVEAEQERVWRAHALRQSDSQVGFVAKQTPIQCTQRSR